MSADLKNWIRSVAAEILDGEYRISALRPKHSPYKPQEVIVGAEGEKMVDALDGGALENGPLTAEEGDHDQQRCRSMAHQKPRYGHPQTIPQTDKSKKILIFSENSGGSTLDFLIQSPVIPETAPLFCRKRL